MATKLTTALSQPKYRERDVLFPSSPKSFYLRVGTSLRFTWLLCAGVIGLEQTAFAQSSQAPSQDVEQITNEAQRTPETPLVPFDRPLYRATQDFKKELAVKYGIHFAIEDTAIYQTTSGGIEPNDAFVNTLGLFATWKVWRSDDARDFAGFGFQAETRSNHIDQFTDLRDDLGSLWSPNDSTSDAYTRINQLWWGQRINKGQLGLMLGKIDAGSIINANRFAGSGNTQFFGQPYATNPARSFPQNGLGVQLRAEPTEWLYCHFVMSDSDAVSDHSPFTTLNGRWLYAGEVGLKPTIPELGAGTYRFMLYHRETDAAHELGWAVSLDQNLSDDYGIFLRYGGNDGDVNSIEHLLSMGFSALSPFGRKNDQAGVGVSYTHPSNEDLRDEYAAEVYYRLQLTDGVEISASAQLIVDPSASDRDAVGVFGLRARLLY